MLGQESTVWLVYASSHSSQEPAVALPSALPSKRRLLTFLTTEAQRLHFLWQHLASAHFSSLPWLWLYLTTLHIFYFCWLAAPSSCLLLRSSSSTHLSFLTWKFVKISTDFELCSVGAGAARRGLDFAKFGLCQSTSLPFTNFAFKAAR